MPEKSKTRTYLVQRWHVVVTRGPDGRHHRQSFTENDPFTELPLAAAHYRRALEGLWAHPSWEEWGVTADSEVVALADCAEPSVSMPGEIHDVLAKLSARMSEGI